MRGDGRLLPRPRLDELPVKGLIAKQDDRQAALAFRVARVVQRPQKAQPAPVQVLALVNAKDEVPVLRDVSLKRGHPLRMASPHHHAQPLDHLAQQVADAAGVGARLISPDEHDAAALSIRAKPMPSGGAPM